MYRLSNLVLCIYGIIVNVLKIFVLFVVCMCVWFVVVVVIIFKSSFGALLCTYAPLSFSLSQKSSFMCEYIERVRSTLQCTQKEVIKNLTYKLQY